MKFRLACVFACAAALAAIQLPAQQKLTLHHHDAAHQVPGTIIIPAADFLTTIPAGDSNDGRFPAGTWFFNESTVNMSVADDLVTTEPVKEAGVYHLFVRSVGTATSSFKVKIDGKEDAGTYGKGQLAWVTRRRLYAEAGEHRGTADGDYSAAVDQRAGADEERGLQRGRSEGAGAAARGEVAA